MKTPQRMLISFLFLAFFSTPILAETVTIRADRWFPINGEPDSPTPGYMIEMATRIFEGAGLSVNYRPMPWKRAIVFVREGRYDCVVGGNKHDTPDFIFPNTNWGEDSAMVYVHKNEKWRYTGLKSLASIHLGMIAGYAYSESVNQFIKENKDRLQLLSGDNALENNIKKLLLGRITATIESPLVMSAKLKEMGLEGEIIPAGQVGEAIDMYIACSPAKKSSKALIKLVDEGTQKLRQSGELKTILDKYGVQDWHH